jgi:NADPH:quinone reductase-like Zn-dependent oxidoreductase
MPVPHSPSFYHVRSDVTPPLALRHTRTNRSPSPQVHASALQPADAKVAKHAVITIDYPGVLGGPVSGTVEALGASVSKITVGERIVCGTKIFAHKKAKYGGLQRFTLVDESEVVVVRYVFSMRKMR